MNLDFEKVQDLDRIDPVYSTMFFEGSGIHYDIYIYQKIK
jgi:hypothetical protein